MRLLFTFLLGCLCAAGLWAQPQAYFDYKQFTALGHGTYIETYLDFLGESLMFSKNASGKNQARVVVTTIIRSDTSIYNFSKREVVSPEAPDSIIPDFLDIQRLTCKPGRYILEIDLEDLNRKSNNKIHFEETIEVMPSLPYAYVSGILFVGNTEQATEATPFTRGSLNIYPFVSNKYFEQISKLMFYAEVYNTKQSPADSSTIYLVAYSIINPKNGEIFRDYQRILKKKADDVVPILASFDISSLPSGHYALAIEVRNAKNELVSGNKRDFYRNNSKAAMQPQEVSELILSNSFVKDLTNLDTLKDYIFSLRPIATESEKAVLDKQDKTLPELNDKKRFFYTFWANRNATSPDVAWQKYRNEVIIANRYFSTPIKRGYETDRGRVYLQYGPPNQRMERPSEPAAYPYEIWQYYHIEQYSNRKFVFYNTDLVTNDYELLHSDMFGEPRNLNWERQLSKRNNPMANPGDTRPRPQHGSNAGEYFQNPR